LYKFRPMEKITCLLVDDDEDDRDLFGMALQDVDESIEYIYAVNCVEALKMLKAGNAKIPDFIFLDLNMPFMNGKECLEELKKVAHLKDIPVIIYTTSSYAQDLEDTRQKGAAHFLSKTSNLDDLVKILVSVFSGESLPFSLNTRN
jgi:CheY-like chemotaxis protein